MTLPGTSRTVGPAIETSGARSSVTGEVNRDVEERLERFLHSDCERDGATANFHSKHCNCLRRPLTK